MKNRVSRWFLIILAAIAASFWWLLIAPEPGAAPAHPIHVDELRKLASIIRGPKPTSVDYTLLGTRKTIGDFVAAGIGLKRRPLAIVAWTLPVPGKGPIMIDPGRPPAAADLGTFDDFDRAKQARLDAEAREASLVLHTQSPDGAAPGNPFHPGTAATALAAPAFPPQPVSFTTAQAVAPGVVVIPASSHAPGARLIFVQLANGREFLFAGNIATFKENWFRLRARSHLAAIRGPAQNRAQTYAWLRTIHQLHNEAPRLRIVPGHDYNWLAEQWSRGMLTEAQLPLVPPLPGRTP